MSRNHLSLALVLLAWVPNALAEAAPAAEGSHVALAAVQSLATDFQQSALRSQRQQAAVDRAALATIDARLQAIRRSGNPDPAIARKLYQLEALVANARHYNALLGRGEASQLPYTALPQGRRVEARADAAAGSACDLAASVPLADPLATTLAPAGSAGDAVWMRVPLAPGLRLALSTLGSDGDVDVTAFADCSATEPLAYDDDYYGLQALLALPSGAVPEVRVRIGNRDTQRTAAARIEVVLASSFSGKVNVSPVPVAVGGLQVSHFEAGQGFYRGSGYVESNGNYTVSAFGDGAFHARTGYFSGSYNVINEAYPDVVCSRADYISISDCTPGSLGVINVSGGQTTTGIDFQLETGRGLGVSVVSDLDGAPVYPATITLSDASGVAIASAWTDQAGRARFQGLRAGIAHYARFEASGFQTEVYDNLPCPVPCTQPAGTPISFTPGGAMVRELSVGLAVRPSLKVYVKDLPTASEYPDARLLYPSGQTAAYGSTQGQSDVPGWRLVAFTDPVPGNYYVIAGYSSSTYSRLHPGVDCLDDCIAQLANALQINIQNGQVPAPIFLEPSAFPKVEGQVLEAGSGNPVSGEITLVSVPGSNYRTTATGSQGDYRFNHVRPGTYLVVARSSQHVDLGYPNAPCNGTPYSNPTCPNASPVLVSSGAAGFRYDFTLSRSASVSGALRLEGLSSAYAFSWSDLSLRRADGIRAAASLMVAQNQYTLSDVESGSYRVVFEPSAPTHGQIYPGIHCGSATCPGGTGQWVAVAGVPVTGIHFDLRLAQGVKGSVLASPGGQPLAGVAIDIWAEQLSGASYVGAVVTGSDGRFVFPYSFAFSGFRVATSVGPDYVNEVYNNVACPLGPVYFGLCSLTAGVVIPSANPVDSRGIVLRLSPSAAGILFEDGME